MTRRGAVRVARRAHRRLDVPLFVALCIALACRKYRVRYALGFALIEQESGYRHVFGHDVGGLFPGEAVTRKRYRQLRDHLRSSGGSGANGVGLTQITYYTYVLDHPGLWRKRANLYFGLSILADYVHRLGERTGCGAYNGGEGNPQLGYADEVLAKASAIRPKLSNRKH